MAYIRKSKKSSVYIYGTGDDEQGIYQDFECYDCTLNNGETLCLKGYRELAGHFLLHYILMEIEIEAAIHFFRRYTHEVKLYSTELMRQVQEAKTWIELLQFEVIDNVVDTYIDNEKKRYQRKFAYYPLKEYLISKFMYPLDVPGEEVVEEYQKRVSVQEIPSQMQNLLGLENFKESGEIKPELIENSWPNIGHSYQVQKDT